MIDITLVRGAESIWHAKAATAVSPTPFAPAQLVTAVSQLLNIGTLTGLKTASVGGLFHFNWMSLFEFYPIGPFAERQLLPQAVIGEARYIVISRKGVE